MLTVGAGAHTRAEQLSGLRSDVDEFGFASLQQALRPRLLRRLQSEAASERDAAVAADVDGDLRFRARMGKLGAVARQFLESVKTTALLDAVFRERFVLSDDASCFTYYGAGDYLGLHCDRASVCLVTMIVYLECIRSNAGSSPQTGLVLNVYGRARQDGEPPRVVIPTTVGGLVIGRGSDTWHERPPLQDGERVTALTACFGRPAGGQRPLHHRLPC